MPGMPPGDFGGVRAATTVSLLHGGMDKIRYQRCKIKQFFLREKDTRKK